jgi:hypothetical protein
MLMYSNGTRPKWDDVEGKFVLLIRGYSNDGTRPLTNWTIARVDDYSDMMESITSKLYYSFGDRNETTNFVNSDQKVAVGGLIHKIFRDFEHAKQAKFRLIAFTNDIIAEENKLISQMQEELDKVAAL